MWLRVVAAFSIFQDGSTIKTHYALYRTNVSGEVLESSTQKHLAVYLSNWQRDLVLIQWVKYLSKRGIRIYIWFANIISTYIHMCIFSSTYIRKKTCVWSWLLEWLAKRCVRHKMVPALPDLYTSACLAQLSRDCVYRQWILFTIKESEVSKICKIQSYPSALYLT